MINPDLWFRPYDPATDEDLLRSSWRIEDGRYPIYRGGDANVDLIRTHYSHLMAGLPSRGRTLVFSVGEEPLGVVWVCWNVHLGGISDSPSTYALGLKQGGYMANQLDTYRFRLAVAWQALRHVKDQLREIPREGGQE